MSCLEESIAQQVPETQELLKRWKESTTIIELVMLACRIGMLLALRLLEAELNRRGRQVLEPAICPECGSKVASKGLVKRTLLTLVGTARWSRRVYRCPNHCEAGQVVPADSHLGLKPNQRTGEEVKRLACALVIFVPYELASNLLSLLTGVSVTPMSIFYWVQDYGSQAQKRFQDQVQAACSKEEAQQENSPKTIIDVVLAIGADGVMAPFRPNGGSPTGKTVWREVKVGMAAKLKEKISSKGKRVLRPIARTVVAVVGEIEVLQPCLWWAALQQGLLQTQRVVWLSDGGKGFWRLWTETFASWAAGVLDFYHVAQYLWKGAKSWLDGRTPEAHEWFRKARRQLKKGKSSLIARDLKRAMKKKQFSKEAYKTLKNLCNYLETHQEHIDYPTFAQLGFPLGSGLIESECNWLIQQRFKCVGMRWSENGFNHLLHLRLAWFNGSFDSLFGDVLPKLTKS